MHQLTEIFIEQQQNDNAEQYARRKLELEPWREKAHRQLMHVLALRGERTAALAQYEHCRKVLAIEFEAEPTAETTALFEEIRSARFQVNELPEQRISTKTPAQVAPRKLSGLTQTMVKRLSLIAFLVVVLVSAGLALLRGGVLSREIGMVLPMEQNLYDDFSETSFDDAYNPSKWTERVGPESNCELVQQDGVLQISHDKLELFSGCTLRVKQPLSVAGAELGSLSAIMQLLDTHNGGFAGTVLRITTEFPDGGWAASCGILADFNSVHILFNIIDLRLGEARQDHLVYEAQQVVAYSTWYEVSLVVNDNAERIACLLDGQIIGEYEVSNPQELATAPINREIGV